MTKDEKPVINSDGVARHRSSSNASISTISSNAERSSLPSLSRTPSVNSHISRNDLTIDVELSRKRKERDGEELHSPGTPHSYASSTSFLMTPQFGPTELSPQHKRRSSIIEHLALKEEDKDFKLTSLGLSSKDSEDDDNPLLSWYKNSYDYPIPVQEPITVFPVQYQIYQQPNANANQNVNTNTNGTNQQQQHQTGIETPALGQQTNSIPLDPTLSSIRSSATQTNNGGQSTIDSHLAPELRAPELRFTDADTLASATASPAKQETGGPSDASTQAAIAATLSAEDAAALLAPPSDGDGSMRKDQPFSRSPELRVSHKLAERKRRKEMKELFDELRDELPSDRGMKASKWEILSKAIDHIRQLKTNQDQMLREIDHLRREVDIARGGTGAYTHAYPTYNIAGSYPPQTNYTNTVTTAGQPNQTSTQTQAQGQTQPNQQTQQAQPQAQQTQQPQQQTQQVQQVQAQPNVQQQVPTGQIPDATQATTGTV
ncbi:uncharacterized protein IL334_000172 [Kwoniella shivajii]|uniref:BHLH domain-containing protein n=1 Tax=Kwoniella shivajii TaxID=564305 RepID=A0ABZ1CPG8_9TREE|nr:hypothetical protein IL334_000172 [Kwoniella shivajii]